MRFATAVRFGPPRPVLPEHAATGPGPAAPQPPSRLEQVTGPASMPQDEDCLYLNVWAPEGASGLPVLVFLHGGGYSSGSGGLPWYDGELLAQRGELVVVTVNYRLGALGFAYLAELADDLGAGNFGLLDQLAAPRWVRDHIAEFGGDPDRVTAAGQSAGAYSIVALLSGVSGRGLFGQAILQSLPGGLLPQRPTEATQISVLLLEVLNLTDATSLREVPVPDILAAQQEVARRANLGVPPPFQLVADGELVAEDPLRTVGERGADGVRIMLTFTRHECSAPATASNCHSSSAQSTPGATPPCSPAPLRESWPAWSMTSRPAGSPSSTKASGPRERGTEPTDRFSRFVRPGRLPGMSTTYTIIDSPLGDLTVVGEDGALTGLYFERHRRRPDPASFGRRTDAGFEEVRRQLGEYFAGTRTRFDLPLAPAGEEFQLRVWRMVAAIPYGETRSYGDLARELGHVSLAQDVGAANGRNPLCVIVPCHRVLGADGSLTGYAGGLHRKRQLLDLEDTLTARLF